MDFLNQSEDILLPEVSRPVARYFRKSKYYARSSEDTINFAHSISLTIQEALSHNPVHLALIGQKNCGKTNLAKALLLQTSSHTQPYQESLTHHKGAPVWSAWRLNNETTALLMDYQVYRTSQYRDKVSIADDDITLKITEHLPESQQPHADMIIQIGPTSSLRRKVSGCKTVFNIFTKPDGAFSKRLRVIKPPKAYACCVR